MSLFQKGHARGGRPKGVPNKANLALKSLAQTYTVEALDTIVSLMRQGKTQETVRLAAAKELLLRGHGPAPEAVDVTGNLTIRWKS